MSDSNTFSAVGDGHQVLRRELRTILALCAVLFGGLVALWLADRRWDLLARIVQL